MATVPQSTLDWLYNVLTQLNYRDPNRAYSDLAQTLQHFPGLSPSSAVYTSDNGVPSLLLNVKGTIPVNFEGTVYRFPLMLWIPSAYPYEAPIVYVDPSPDMVVRQGQHVSGADGKVYHQYLASWAQTWDRSNVVTFLRILADVFAREAPVKARPQGGRVTQSFGPGRPPQPPPPQRPHQRQDSQGSSNLAGRPPPPPPPPKQPPGAASSSRPASASPGPPPPPPAPKPSRYDAPPPLPSQMPSQSPGPRGTYANGHSQQPPGGMQYMPQRQSYQATTQGHAPSQQHRTQSPPGSVSSPGPPYPQQSPYSQASQQYTPAQHPQLGTAHQSTQPTQQYPTPSHTYQSRPQSQTFMQQSDPQQPQRQQPPPPPQQSKAPQRDLLAEEDPFQISLPTTQSQIPVPSIPPNPEKAALLSHLSHQILQHLHQSISQTSEKALRSLEPQHVALTTTHQNLSQEIQHLQTMSASLSSNINALTNTINQANSTISSTRDPTHPSNPSNIPSIDDIIIPPTVIARQLYDNVAEQRGYEAAMYALNEAFVRGRIGSEIWGRKVRECAREEFRRKWMVKRIGDGLGLEGV